MSKIGIIGNCNSYSPYINGEIRRIILEVIAKYLTPGIELITNAEPGICLEIASIVVRSDIDVILAVPHTDFSDSYLLESDKQKYMDIITRMNSSIHPMTRALSKGGNLGEFRILTDMWIVSESDVIICMWDGSRGHMSEVLARFKGPVKNMYIINPAEDHSI